MSTTTETLKLIISGDGKLLRAEIGQSNQQIDGFTRKTTNAFARMGKNIAGKIKGMVTSPLAGLAAGAGVLALGKQIVDFDSDLMRLAIQGKLSTESVVGLRKSIIDTAISSGQSREGVLSGLDAMVEKTGNIKFATEVIDDLAKASTATGATIADLGGVASNLNEKMGIGPTDILKALNLLTVQGKAGAFTLENMAAQGERLFASAGRLGLKGLPDLQKFGALLQVARTGTGSSEQATTAIERIMSSIIEKQDVIASLGFDVFSNKEAQQFKSIDEIIKGVITKAKGNEKILSNVFGEEGIRGVSTLARVYRETGGFDLYDKLASADASNANEILNDFSRYSEVAAFKLMQLQEIGKNFADKVLSKSIQQLSDKMNDLMSDPKKMENFQDGLDRIANAISNIGTAALKLSPLLSLLGAIPEIVFGSDQIEKTKIGQKAFKTLPKSEQRRLRPMIKGNKFSEGVYSVMQREYPNIVNNIMINQAADGRVESVTSDSLNSKNKVEVNRGNHTAVQ